MRIKISIALIALSLALYVNGENVKINGQEYPYQIVYAELTQGRFEITKSFHDADGMVRHFKQTYVAENGKVVKGKAFVEDDKGKWIGVKE
jgi:hypothetical protein